MSLTKIGSIGINTGIQLAGVTTVSTLHVGSGVTLSSDGDIFATGISTFSEDIKVGSGVTISPDGDIFTTGVTTATKFVGANAEVSGDLSGATGTFTGDVSIADKIIHTGDTNTAIRFPAADTISLETAGTEASRIDSSGNFMVGTTSAAGKVSVQGAAGGVALQTTDATNSTFRISHPSSAVTLLAGGSSQHLALGTGFAEKLRIDSSGLMGLGTNSPSSFNSYARNFVIAQSSGDAGMTISAEDDGGEYGSLHFAGGTTVKAYIDQQNGSTGRMFLMNKLNGYMGFGTNNTERLRIDSSGRTLIGTTTQNNNAKLQVTTDQQVVATFEGTGSSDPQIYLGDDMSSPTNNCVIMGYDKADNRGYLTIGGDADTTLTINDGSLIGVNTNDPVEHFGVAGNIRLVNPTGTTRRITALPSGAYSTGTSGGSAIGFTRFSDAGGGSDEIIFETHFQGTQHEEAARFDKYGNLKFPNGHGIDFSSKSGSNGGATSSILDDYEEGTYTISDTSGASVTYTANSTTRYVKIGQLVHVQFDVTLSNGGSSTADARFNLPFSLNHTYGSGVVGWTDYNKPTAMHVSSTVYLMDNDSNTSIHIKNNEANNKRFIGSFFYLAAT